MAFYHEINGRNIAKKILLLNIIIYMCFGILFSQNIFAAQSKYTYKNGGLSSYKGYDTLIQNLKAKHPNWTFTILDTGLDWNDVIKNETVAVHERNLVPSNYTSGSWFCTTCKGKASGDGSGWTCASQIAVAYYMDPRNWLNDAGIFQFEDLNYDNNAEYTVEGINKIIADVPWMQGNKVSYFNTSGKTVSLDKSYAQIILEAGKENGINPYHIAARIRQEQGCKSTASSTGKGNYSGYVGYYNFFNINATNRS